MITSKALRRAHAPRARLRDGTRPSLGIVHVGNGSRLTFELVVRIALADLTRFTRATDTGREVEADRWQQLSEDLGRLHRMAFEDPRPWAQPDVRAEGASGDRSGQPHASVTESS